MPVVNQRERQPSPCGKGLRRLILTRKETNYRNYRKQGTTIAALATELQLKRESIGSYLRLVKAHL